MTKETIQWCADNIDIWERQKQTNDKHLNAAEMDMLRKISKEVDGDDTDLTPNCLRCRQKLIKVIFEQYEKEISTVETNQLECE